VATCKADANPYQVVSPTWLVAGCRRRTGQTVASRHRTTASDYVIFVSRTLIALSSAPRYQMFAVLAQLILNRSGVVDNQYGEYIAIEMLTFAHARLKRRLYQLDLVLDPCVAVCPRETRASSRCWKWRG
jgi:hypothetical protein